MSRPYSTIFEAATTCCLRLQQNTNPMDFPALVHDEWARKRLADFNLWASGSGALAKQRALDLRLVSQPQVKEVVINLLSLLETYLGKCQEAAHASKSNCPDPSLDVRSDRTVEISDAETTLASISNLLKGVEVMINQLVRISIAIHRSGVRARLGKADQTFNANRHCELRDHLYILIYASTLGHDDRIAGKHCVAIKPYNLTRIQIRLIEANLRRRHRFLYAQRHSRHQRMNQPLEIREIKHHQQKQTEVQSVSATSVDLTGPDPKSSEGESPRRHTVHSKRKDKCPSTTDTASSLTAFDGPIKIPMGEQLSTTAPSSTCEKIVYPRARTIPGQDLFTCPCCCQSLPVHISSGSRWRKHLSEDILPYTCILPDCSRPNDLYKSRVDWMNHMQNDHLSSQYWLCLACPEPHKFIKEEDFAQHLMSCHEDSISAEDIPFFVAECAYTAPVEIGSCPLCPASFCEDSPTEAGKVLDEIAKHIHSFSLNSLPWPVPGEKELEFLGWQRNDEFDYFDISSDRGSLDKIEPSASEGSIVDSDNKESPDLEFEDFGPREGLAESIPELIQGVEGDWDAVYATSTIRGYQSDMVSDRTMQELILKYNFRASDNAQDQKMPLEETDKFQTEDEAFLQAAREGDEDRLKSLLLEGIALIDFKDKWNGQTALSWAAREGHATIVKWLLDSGAEIDSMDNYGQSPLIWAVENEHSEVVNMLLAAGADVERKDDGKGQTPLIFATRRGHEKIVKSLLSWGANIESRDGSYGQTPLLWAAESGHCAVVKLLLGAGADIEAKDGINGQTPLSSAARKGHLEIVQLLLNRGANTESRDDSYAETPLLWATGNGHDDVVKLLLVTGADIEAKDRYGRTSLSWAIQKGHEGMVKLFKEYHARSPSGKNL